MNSINQYKTPKLKIDQIQNFFSIVNIMVSKQSQRIVGAEEVFPLVVITILKGNIMKLKSNLNFIKLFRHKTRLESAEDYYFTALSSAISFIETLNFQLLTIKKEDFFTLLKDFETNESNLEVIKEPKRIKNYFIYFLR